MKRNSICVGAKYKRHASVSYPWFRGRKIYTHLDTILDCTDQLIDQWRRTNDRNEIHLDINEQTQQLLLEIFGLIAFDYDLQIFDHRDEQTQKELIASMDVFFNAIARIVEMPKFIGRVYLFCNFKYRHARSILNNCIERIIDQELAETASMRAERKRTSLIASLVSSLQENETIKSEEDKRGILTLTIESIKSIFSRRSFTR